MFDVFEFELGLWIRYKCLVYDIVLLIREKIKKVNLGYLFYGVIYNFMFRYYVELKV